MEPAERHDEATGAGEASEQQARQARASDEFLVPGPTAESNEGTLRWGVSWLVFSLLLMVFMLALSFVCWVLARVTGIA